MSFIVLTGSVPGLMSTVVPVVRDKSRQYF